MTSLYVLNPSPVVLCIQKVPLAPELLVSMGPSHHLWFLPAKQRLYDQNYKSQWVPTLIGFFCKQNNDFWTRITSLCGSQTSTVVLCLLNRVISTRITSFYGSQPSSVVFERKTATFGPELQVSKGPRPHLLFCVCKTAWLAPELLVSMGPSRHLWFLHAKQHLLDLNYKSLWVLDFSCSFVHAKQHD